MKPRPLRAALLGLPALALLAVGGAALTMGGADAPSRVPSSVNAAAARESRACPHATRFSTSAARDRATTCAQELRIARLLQRRGASDVQVVVTSTPSTSLSGPARRLAVEATMVLDGAAARGFSEHAASSEIARTLGISPVDVLLQQHDPGALLDTPMISGIGAPAPVSQPAMRR